MSRRERCCALCTLGVLGEDVLGNGGLTREVTTLCVVKSVLTSSREMRGEGERLRRESSSFVVSSSVVLFLEYAVSIDDDDVRLFRSFLTKLSKTTEIVSLHLLRGKGVFSVDTHENTSHADDVSGSAGLFLENAVSISCTASVANDDDDDNDN